MGNTRAIVVAVVLSTVIMFLALTAIVTRASVSLQKSIDLLGLNIEGHLQDNIQSDLVSLKDKLSAMHGSQESMVGGIKTIDTLVDLINKHNHSAQEKPATQQVVAVADPEAARAQEAWQTYTRDEMGHIGALLAELKNGFATYQNAIADSEKDVLAAVNGVATSVGSWKSSALEVRGSDQHAAALGSLATDESMQQHANIAAIRPDLPRLLPSVRLLIGILSGPSNIERRQEVRQTWVKEYRKSLGLARQWSVWFLVSSPKSEEEAQQIRNESAEYGDIMLMSYLTEDYHLIGAKVVEFFHAASLFPQLQFVMKGDDDTFVRLDRLLAQLDEHRGGNLFMGCNMGRMPPIRKVNNKRYYVSPTEYSPDAFPKYCSGGGYVLSMDVVRAFDFVGQAVGYEPFKFEDVNTGMLIDIAGLDISPTQGKGFYCWGPKKENTEISSLREDWVVFHYVGLKKRWTMAKLVEAVHAQEPTIIFQKKLRIEAHGKMARSWGVREIELYGGGACEKKDSLAKAFGIGPLARRREDNKATTRDNTYYSASSNEDTAALAFDGDLATSWNSTSRGTIPTLTHSLTLKYGVHSMPFSKIACVKVMQTGMPVSALDVWFWDDDDAQWTLAFENVRLKQGTTDTYPLVSA